MSTNIQKKITIDPKYLSLSGGEKTKKARDKNKKYNNIKHNIKHKSNAGNNSKTMRKKLIEKIKQYQNTRELDDQQPPVKETSFDDEFSASLEFLQELSDKKKKKGILKNRTMQNNIAGQNIAGQNIAGQNIAGQKVMPMPNNIAGQNNIAMPKMENTNIYNSVPKNRSTVKHKQPEYSCLKDGSRPTFREWKRTTQRSDMTHTNPTNIKICIPTDSPLQQNPVHKERSEQLDKIKCDYKQSVSSENLNTNIAHHKPTKRCIAHRKIRTVKYKLGKTGSCMSVLVKNTNTRRRIKHEISLLRQKAITEVKQYLRDKNLLKIGSDAPNDVLRQMYEQAVLSGELNNKNDDTLMHNFMTDKG